MPRFGSLKPVTVKTTSRCRRVKFWFAGNGYLRFQCKMGGRGKEVRRDAPTVTWSAIHMTEEREEREHQEFVARMEKIEEERRPKAEKEKKEAAERRHEEATRRVEEATRGTERKELGHGTGSSASQESENVEEDGGDKPDGSYYEGDLSNYLRREQEVELPYKEWDDHSAAGTTAWTSFEGEEED